MSTGTASSREYWAATAMTWLTCTFAGPSQCMWESRTRLEGGTCADVVALEGVQTVADAVAALDDVDRWWP